MKIITGFEDEFSKEDSDQCRVLNEGFPKLLKVLSFSHDVAENVFARLAKRAFRKYTEGGMFSSAKDARGLRPTWIVESSIILLVSDDESTYPELAMDLQKLVTCLGEAFLTAKHAHVVLIEPLKCSIQIIGEQDYKFTLKQMWAPQ